MWGPPSCGDVPHVGTSLIRRPWPGLGAAVAPSPWRGPGGRSEPRPAPRGAPPCRIAAGPSRRCRGRPTVAALDLGERRARDPDFGRGSVHGDAAQPAEIPKVRAELGECLEQVGRIGGSTFLTCPSSQPLAAVRCWTMYRRRTGSVGCIADGEHSPPARAQSNPIRASAVKAARARSDRHDSGARLPIALTSGIPSPRRNQ
jgi:hypothetical protein